MRLYSGIAILALLILVAGIALGSLSAPCLTEDSTWCTWYSEIQGNGQGDSFTSLTNGITIKH